MAVSDPTSRTHLPEKESERNETASTPSSDVEKAASDGTTTPPEKEPPARDIHGLKVRYCRPDIRDNHGA